MGVFYNKQQSPGTGGKLNIMVMTTTINAAETIVLELKDLRKGTEGMGSDQRNQVLKGKVADIIKQALGEDCRYLDNIHYTYRDGVIHRLVNRPEGFSAEEYTDLTGYLIPRSTSAGVILEKDGRCVLHGYLGDISAAMRGRDCSDKSTIVTSVMAETNAYIRIV